QSRLPESGADLGQPLESGQRGLTLLSCLAPAARRLVDSCTGGGSRRRSSRARPGRRLDASVRPSSVQLLIMSTKPLAVVVLTDDVGVLQADVAGHPVSHYLLERLRLGGGIDVQVALRSDALAPGWCAGLPTFAGGLPALRDPVLIVDARAWLAADLPAKLTERVREQDAFIRVLESSPEGDRAGGQRILAAAFPARM